MFHISMGNTCDTEPSFFYHSEVLGRLHSAHGEIYKYPHILRSLPVSRDLNTDFFEDQELDAAFV